MKPTVSTWSTAALITLSLLLGGCASGLGGADYKRGETRRVQEVRMGVIEDVRTVRIEGTSSGVGAAAGTVVGGVAGSGIGGGRGRVVGAVLGAVAGGVAGSAIEESSTRKPGLELTIRLETGRVIAIVQEDDGTDFRRGDRVRVIGSGGQARVSR